MKITAALPLLGACVSLPHVDPDPRTVTEAGLTAVRVRAQCSWDFDKPVRYGTGVMISERHVLTAQHVVECPDIPDVHVGLSSGRVLRMVVTEEDRVADISRLEILSADRFRVDVAPPTLGYPRVWDDSCAALAWPYGSHACGPYMGDDIVSIPLKKGSSGAGVYTQHGHLIGIVIRGDGESYTRISPVTAKWLSGT